MKKGISLIVLVITIIVMIILAASVVITLSNTGVINRASDAVNKTNFANVKTIASTIWAEAYMNGKRGQALIDEVTNKLEQQGITVEDYSIQITDTGITMEEENWEMAFVYDKAEGTWSSKILATDNKNPQGDIVVKLYNTGKTVSPDGFSFSGINFEFEPATSYKMVIQGSGDMGALASADMTNFYAWQADTYAYASEQATTCIIPYVTEIVVEKGVTNIGEFAFFGATSLTKLVIKDSVNNIGNFAFMYASKLTDVTVPNSWNTIEESNNLAIGMYNDELLTKIGAHTYRTKVERLANEGWQKAHNGGATTESALETATLNYIKAGGISEERLALYDIDVTTTGVNVTGKATTLGEAILNGADYGKTINYSANGINDWLVLYKQTVGTDEYVYLVTTDELEANKIPSILTSSVGSGGSGASLEGKNIYWSTAPSVVSSGTINKERWLANWSNYGATGSGRCITYLLDETNWTAFKNTEKYGDNVVGAIGTATLEMFAASYNQKSTAIGDTGTNSILSLTAENYGYKINNQLSNGFSHKDQLIGDIYAWFASPVSHDAEGMYFLLQGISVDSGPIYTAHGLRPVVCLKSSTPVKVGVTANSTDIVIQD